MVQKITYQSCPACQSANIMYALSCKDYTVSGEEFEIWECGTCSLRLTQHVPGAQGIGKYYQSENYISHSDSGKGLVNQLYKLARRYTLGSKRNFVARQTGTDFGSLLDVGCGTGAFLDEMKNAGWQINGLEPDPGARAKAKTLYGIHPQTPDELFKLVPSFYDAITLWHVLEHVHDLQGYMAQLKKLLSPTGKLFIAVPNYTSADASHYGKYWAAYDVPRHLYHFSPNSIKKLAASHGFTVATIKPMLLDAFYIAMLSEQYKNGKGNLVKAVWQGLVATVKALANKEKSSSLIYVLSLG